MPNVRLQVINLRDELPDITVSELAKALKVSRQRISQILKDEGLPTRVPKIGEPKKTGYICNNCGKPILYDGKQNKPNSLFCCRECFNEYYTCWVECYYCHDLFKLSYSELKNRVYRHAKKGTELMLFCNKYCFGRYVGEKYGFAAPHRIRN